MLATLINECWKFSESDHLVLFTCTWIVFSFIFLFFSEYIELLAKGHLFVHPKRDMATSNNIFLIPKQLHEKFFGIIQAL